MILGEGWIEGRFSEMVAFVKQKDCKEKSFDENLAEQDYERISDISECTMKYRVGYSQRFECKGYWEVCKPTERGACKFFCAEVKYA